MDSQVSAGTAEQPSSRAPALLHGAHGLLRRSKHLERLLVPWRAPDRCSARSAPLAAAVPADHGRPPPPASSGAVPAPNSPPSPLPSLHSMEEAYLAALEKVGGLEAAKPRAILDELQAEFPHLTLQASGRMRGMASGKPSRVG